MGIAMYIDPLGGHFDVSVYSAKEVRSDEKFHRLGQAQEYTIYLWTEREGGKHSTPFLLYAVRENVVVYKEYQNILGMWADFHSWEAK